MYVCLQSLLQRPLELRAWHTTYYECDIFRQNILHNDAKLRSNQAVLIFLNL